MEKTTAKASYKASVRGSRIDIEAPALDIELNQMIVWIMTQPQAVDLLPAYRELRKDEA